MPQRLHRFFIILSLLGAILTVPVAARAGGDSPDYEFYKKYGNTSKQWDDNVRAGFDAYDRQDCDQALRALKDAIAAQTQDALVFYKVAVCSELTGTPYTALQYYQLAEEKLQTLKGIHPYQRDINESYGRALFQAKKYDQAFPYLQRAVALGTPNFGIFYMVGYLYMTKNDNRAAVEMFERALAQDISKVPPATLATVYREVGKAHFQNKDYVRASELIQKTLQINPNDPEATKINNQLSSMQQQNQVMGMMDSMTKAPLPNPDALNKPTDTSQPPLPPAASKLPPLNPPTAAGDPTPPLGNVVPEGAPPPAPAPAPAPAPSGSGAPPKLEPLPPLTP